MPWEPPKEIAKKKERKLLQELPLWLRRLRIQLVSMRMWIRSLASLSRLRLQM